jgi:hypothetical protein
VRARDGPAKGPPQARARAFDPAAPGGDQVLVGGYTHELEHCGRGRKE